MIGELLDPKGYNAVLMVVDRLSKRIHAIPTVTSLDSARVAQLFLEHIWHHHGLPEEVISDHGPAFVSNFFHNLATLLGVKLTPSTSYHPQTDGQTECVNQEIEAYLHVFVQWANKPLQCLPVFTSLAYSTRTNDFKIPQKSYVMYLYLLYLSAKYQGNIYIFGGDIQLTSDQGHCNSLLASCQ